MYQKLAQLQIFLIQQDCFGGFYLEYLISPTGTESETNQNARGPTLQGHKEKNCEEFIHNCTVSPKTSTLYHIRYSQAMLKWQITESTYFSC